MSARPTSGKQQGTHPEATPDLFIRAPVPAYYLLPKHLLHLLLLVTLFGLSHSSRREAS